MSCAQGLARCELVRGGKHMRKMPLVSALLVAACSGNSDREQVAEHDEAVEVQCPATLPQPARCSSGWIYNRYKGPCYDDIDDAQYCPPNYGPDYDCHICYHVS